MSRPRSGRRGSTLLLILVALVVSATSLPGLAQFGRGGPPAAAGPARQAAPIDLTGYWVAIVNEDWRWRMITPEVGDVSSVPVNGAGRAAANAWELAQDGSCKAYGAAGLMRMPLRLHIQWAGDNELVIETDAGQQIRRLLFGASAPAGPRTLQGHSTAEWQRAGGGRGGFFGGGPGGRGGPPAQQSGSLRVVTTHMSPGWLRRNGVPYGESAVLTEYFDRFPGPAGDEWLVVTSIVEDPEFLTRRFVTSSHFRREPDGANWNPQPCRQVP